MKVSDLFLKCLEVNGVKYIFGVPGEENADIMMSLLDSPVEFITCVHEQTAAFMADMYGRLTNEPGICLATLGPGATNLLTGVANANMDHSPCIAVIGQADSNRLHKESHQNMDSVDMFKPVTKWSVTVRDPSAIPEVVSKAFKLAKRPKMGAVLIELPEDLARENVDMQPSKFNNELKRGVGDVSGLVDMINEAKNPVLLVGYGAVRSKCDAELKEFLDKTGIYAATTFMAKGVVDDRHPQSLRCVGLGMKDIALEAFDKADLVICAGYGMVEWHADRWNKNSDKKVVHIDFLPAEVDECYNPDLEIIGDIRAALQTLNKALTKASKKIQPEFALIRERIQTDLHRLDNDQGFPVKPQRVLADLRKVMGEKDIVVSDVGAHKMWVSRQYPTYHSKTCFIHNGFCSMGGAMPGAIVAKMLYPEKRVVAVCGDGGFLMSIQALATGVRYNVGFVTLVWEDHHYGLIRWKQQMGFDKSSHTELKGPDIVEVSKGFGAHSERISSVDELMPSLEAAFARKDKPTVLVVPIDYAENMKLTEHLKSIVTS
jgi:acetolactate synthase-1/2/3 large subunit